MVVRLATLLIVCNTRGLSERGRPRCQIVTCTGGSSQRVFYIHWGHPHLVLCLLFTVYGIVYTPNIKIGDSDIKPSSSARNLGVIFDSTFNQDLHVNNICKKAYCQIRAIGRIRKYLDRPSVEKLVNSLVTVHLDYFTSAEMVCRGPRLQNTRLMARVLTLGPRHPAGFGEQYTAKQVLIP